MASSLVNLFLSYSPSSISDSFVAVVSNQCGCYRKAALSGFCVNLFHGELSFSNSFKLYRLCNSSFKLDWQWEHWKINASRMCVFYTMQNSSLGDTLLPCVGSQVGTGRQGSMLTSPWAGFWPLSFPTTCSMTLSSSMTVSALVSWCHGILACKTQTHSGFQWAGVFLAWQSGQVGSTLKRGQYISGKCFQLPWPRRILQVFPLNSLAWLGWKDGDKMQASLQKTTSLTFLFQYTFSPSWLTHKQLGLVLLAQGGRTPLRASAK